MRLVPQPIQASQQITAGFAPVEGVPLAEQHGQLGGQLRHPPGGPAQQQVAEPGMEPQPAELATVGREGPCGIEAPQLLQQQACLPQTGRRWRIQPGQLLAQGVAPLGQLQGDRHRVGLQQFRRIEGRTARLLRR